MSPQGMAIGASNAIPRGPHPKGPSLKPESLESLRSPEEVRGTLLTQAHLPLNFPAKYAVNMSFSLSGPKLACRKHHEQVQVGQRSLCQQAT